MVGLMVAIYEVGCFLGSVATAFVGESIGRKKSIGIGVVIMIIGALLQSTAYSRSHMIAARVISGTGMGMLHRKDPHVVYTHGTTGFINSTVPVFQAEFSPKATRGLCMLLSYSLLAPVSLLGQWLYFF